MSTATTECRDLDADLAICEAATPGEWETDGYAIFQKLEPGIPRTYSTIAQLLGAWTVSNTNHELDCRFMVAARSGWPYAIRRAQKAERENDRLRNELQILQEQLQRYSVGCDQ